MKKKEIKKINKNRNLKNLENFKKDLFNLRFQKNNGQLKILQNLKKLEKI